MPLGQMGWGDPKDTVRKTQYREAIAWGVMQRGMPTRALSELGPVREESIIEKELRKLFQFDAGWAMWYAERIVYGQDLVPGPQTIGNCVGYSHCMILAAKVAHELLVEGDPEDVLGEYVTDSPIPYIPYSYGAGRVYIGGNQINGDGSLGSWQIKASMEHGFLPSDLEGLPGPVPQSTENVGRQWGRSKSMLDTWRPKAIIYDVLDTVKITSGDAGKEAVVKHRTPLQIASNWGFASAGHDPKYDMVIHRRSGSWSHQMQVIGIIEVKGQWFVVIRNQWGTDAHPKAGRDIPLGCFVIPFEVFVSWVKSAEVYTIGEIKGRPAMIGFPV